MNRENINISEQVNLSLSKKYLLLIIALFFNYLNTGGIKVINLIGIVSYVITGFLIVSILLHKSKFVTYKTLAVFWCILLIFVYLIWNSGNSILRVMITIMQLSIIILIAIVGLNFRLDEYFIKKYSKIHKILIVILYLMVLARIAGIPIMFKNLNALSEMASLFFILNIFFYYMSNTRIKLYNSLIYVPALNISGGRNMLLCAMVFIIMFFSWKIVSKNIFLRICTFTLVAILIYVITIKYPEWYYNSSMVKLNHFIREVTGKNFFSGRQEIWRNILELVSNKMWMGYGTGTLYSNLANSKLSAHNQYLQLYMQSGIIGIVILFGALYIIWIKISKCTNITMDVYKRKRLSGSFLIAFMIANIFTVSMIQNTIYSSLMGWFMIGIGLGKIRNIGEK